jgi:hypothetical protein
MVEIEVSIKRLSAALFKMRIQEYLIGKDFDYLCMEKNTDEVWKHFEDQVRAESSVAILIPGYTGYAEEAFPRFLHLLYSKEKEFLPSFLTELIHRALPKLNRTQLEEIASKCEEMGYDARIEKGSIQITNRSKPSISSGSNEEDQSLGEALDEVASSLSIEVIRSLLPDDLKKEGQNMGEAYVFLYCVENSLRLFIDATLRQQYGANYFGKIQTNKVIRNKLIDRKKAEKENQWLPVRGQVEVFYLDFGDLGTIIQNNWDSFSHFFPNQKWITQKIDELSSIRNLVAHNSMISKTERDLIRVYYSQIMRQIESGWPTG